jgi:lysophospholipase
LNPFPITVIDSKPPVYESLPPGTNLPANATVYEATPFEFGSYDPDLSAFIDMKYLGTKLNQLQPASSTSCVTNFDQAGFIIGSSSSLFFVSNWNLYLP